MTAAKIKNLEQSSLASSPLPLGVQKRSDSAHSLTPVALVSAPVSSREHDSAPLMETSGKPMTQEIPVGEVERTIKASRAGSFGGAEEQESSSAKETPAPMPNEEELVPSTDTGAGPVLDAGGQVQTDDGKIYHWAYYEQGI